MLENCRNILDQETQKLDVSQYLTNGLRNEED